jgi:hypothetical protein
MSKSFMKKITSLMFGAVLVLGVFAFATPSHAAVQFSNTSSCWPDVVQAMPGNSAQQNQTNCSDWLGNPTINPGGTLWVGVYIRNTGSSAATNTNISLTKTQNGQNNFSFHGSVNGGGSSISGNATAAISGSGTQDFTLQTVKLYINQDGMGNMLLLDTLSGSQAQAILNGGVSIGTIPGIYNGNCYNGATNPWCTQGMVVATFTATNNQTQTYACSNGYDDDGDGYVDMSDPGCSSPTDSSEYNQIISQTSCNITNFNVSDSSIDEGDSTTLSWNSTGAYGAHISGPNGFYQGVGANGSLTVSPNTSANYTLALNCQSNTIQGDISDSVYVSVDEENSQSCEIDTFYASPSSIDEGDHSTLHWNTTDADSVYISGPNLYQSVNDDGALNVYPNNDATYTIHVNCDNGDDETDTTHVSVDENNNNNNSYACSNGYDDDGDGYVDMNDIGCVSMYDTSEYNQMSNFNVTTTVASNITTSSATLNGLVTNANGSTSGYFQWGPSYSLGYTTPTQYIGSNNTIPMATSITGLQAETFYYFRAVAVVNGVVKYGNIMPFKTIAGPIITNNTTTVVKTVVVGGGNGNLLDLKVNMNEELACSQGAHDFNVTYKNVSGVTVKDIVVRVTFPKYVDYRSSSAGTYTDSDNTLTVQIPQLVKGEEGTITIAADTQARAYKEPILVTTATASYRNNSNVLQEDAIAYGVVETTRCANNNLLGFAFGAGFWPTSVVGWLLILILILVLIYIARRIYQEKPKKTVTTTERYSPTGEHTTTQTHFYPGENH